MIIMEIQQLSTLLSGNSYPGRGIVLGRSKDGKTAMIAYFIMGRSVNSRNRVFEENDRGGIRTKAFDESKMEDPSLIIYNPVLCLDGKTIVTSGKPQADDDTGLVSYKNAETGRVEQINRDQVKSMDELDN